ncbi:major capsid family protein [Gilliamella apicola]|uniref:major capsid family protein n=1 Tax=Gilliamella apicola TaxID=1196095 RepID=UPI002FEDF2AD
MAYENVDYSDIITEQLLERDKNLQEKELPEINIGEAVPITEGLEFGVEEFEYGVTEVRGSLENGVIGIKTTSLETIDSEIIYKKTPVTQWAKGLIYTQQEVEKALRLDINLTLKKQNDLYSNALATIQYAGYLGHKQSKGQEGLLTGKKIDIHSVNKSFKEMTCEECVEVILLVYRKVWERSNFTVQPTHIAMDASDFMDLMQKFDPNSTIVGVDLLPIAAMDRIMAALRKASKNDNFNIEFVKIPADYAKRAKKDVSRLVVYTYDEDYLEMKVHMPELLETHRKDLLTYQSGYRSAFSGVMWKEPNSAQYLDYKSAA